MEKNALGRYGKIVCTILVIAILMTLAAPFSSSIRAAIMDVVTSVADKSTQAIDSILNDDGMVDSGNEGGESSDQDSNYGELNQYGFYFDKPYTAKVTMDNGISTSMSIICYENNTYVCYAGGVLHMSGSATYNNDGTVVCDMGGMPVPSTLSADGKTVTLPAGFLGSSPVDFVCDPTPKTVKYNIVYKGTASLNGIPTNVAFELLENNTSKMYIEIAGEYQLNSTYALQYTPISGISDTGLAFLMSNDGNTVTMDALIAYNAFGVANDIVFTADSVSEPESETSGLYDTNGDMLASWAVLVNNYGLNVEKDFMDADTNVTIETDSSSMFYILNNNPELSAGTKLVVDPSVKKIGAYAFTYCLLEEISLPNTITTIGQQAFNLNHLSTMVIPDSVITIDYGAFTLTNISNLTIGNSVEIIGEYAFGQLNNFSGEIVIPDSVKTIEALAFEMTPMTSVILGDSVETIGRRAFYSCDALTSVVISKSVTTIEEMAFDDCDNLTDVYFTGTQAEWNALIANIGEYNECLTGATIHFNYIP